MADTTYSIAIDTSAAQRSLDGLMNTLGGLGAAIAAAFSFNQLQNVAASFEDLRISLEILYGSVKRGNQVFADIKKLAAETVFSVEDLTNTVIKLKASGIEPTVELLKLFGDVSSVSADKVGALQAITDLYARTTAGGLGLEDLNRLADRGIPVFTILQEKLGLTRLELTALGQTSEGAKLILDALEVGLSEKFGGGSEKRMATVSQAISNIKDQFNNIVDVISRIYLNKPFVELLKSLAQVMDNLKPLIAVIAMGLGGAMKILADNVTATTLIFGTFFAVVSVGAIVRIGQALLALAGSFTLLGATPLGRALTLIGLALGAVVGSTIVAKTGAGELGQKYKELNDELNKFSKGPGGEGLATGKLADSTRNFKAEAEGLNTALAKIRAELDNIGTAYANQNAEVIKRLNLELSLVGASEKTKTIRQAVAQEEQRYQQQINSLTDQYKIKSTSKNQEDIKALPLIKAQMDRITAEYRNHVKNVEELNSKLYDRNELEKQRLALVAFSQQVETTTGQKIRDLQNEAATTLLPTINKQYYDIAAAATQQARAGIEAENNRRRLIGVTAMSTAEEARYYDVALKNIGPLIEAQRELNAVKEKQQLRLFQRKAEVDLEKQLLDIRQSGTALNLDKLGQSYQTIDRAARDAAESELQAYAQRQNISRLQIDPSIVKQYYDAATKGSQQLKDAQKQLNVETEKRQFKLVEQKTAVDLEKQLLDIKQSQAALNLGTLEKTYQGIDRAARDAAESELQAYAQRQNISRLDINPAIVKQYYDNASKGSQQLKAAQAGLYEQSRQFQTGWKQAITSYVEDATNGAKIAQNVFNKTFSAMEDLLFTFAKTGKFQWKNFVQTLADELLRSNIKQLLASVFGSAQDGMGGLGKLLGGLSGAFGLGKGAVGDSATNPIYAFLVNGGSGLASAAGAVGQTATKTGGGILDALGNVVTGIGSAISGVVGGIADAVGGIFGGGGGGLLSGIASIFGFADGGVIPNNRPVIVGERGPELLAGASGMRVMSNQDAFGGSNVTYNISAVDAPSFQALIARDPSFIHAVSMQGAKSMGRRY